MILGIESSCDETALTLLAEGKHVVAEKVSSQITHHLPYGGVVPELASRKHLEALPLLFSEILKDLFHHNSQSTERLEAVAVSAGPGLLGSLLVGTEFSKGLAFGLKVPLIAVDHVLAHFHGAFLTLLEKGESPHFPALGYVISGGHTHLFEIKSYTEYKLIAQTIDDACGECFDKVGKILGLPYPGGPHLEKLAKKGNPQSHPMPRMMSHTPELNLSYSGLKTYVANLYKKHPTKARTQESWRADVAASFQHEAFDQILRKLDKAKTKYPHIRALYICGGVACNKLLREKVRSWGQDHHLAITFAKPQWCTDNATMIASAGHHLLKTKPQGDGFSWQPYSRFQGKPTTTP